jgi:hypothetical protein
MAFIDFPEIQRVRRAMRDAGATGPATARVATELPDVVQEDLDRFLDAEIIREGAPGTYYLDEATASAVRRIQLLKAAIFWFLVVITPIAILQLSNLLSAP